MQLPDYFSRIPALTVRDPLAEMLGAADGGLIEYRFADAVKLAGHACPTVAAAWLATVRGLQALYGHETPVRGEIAVALPETVDDGVAGVIASIATLLTGAAGAVGFKGLGGHHERRNLLSFGVHGVAGIRLTRCDTGESVDCVVHLKQIPGDPRIGGLLLGIIQGSANDQDKALFRQLWQDRVRRILLPDEGAQPIVDIFKISGTIDSACLSEKMTNH